LNKPVTTAIVLAAGRGSRLNGWDIPKPLQIVGGETLLGRTLRLLGGAGVTKTVLVLGFRANEIQQEVPAFTPPEMEVKIVVNPDFDLQNGVSVLAARELVQNEPFFLTMADHILSENLLNHARAAAIPADSCALLVDFNLAGIFDMDDATKVEVENGLIKNIGKKLTQFNAVDTGVFVCNKALFNALELVYSAKGDVSLSEGIAALARQQRMFAIPINGAFWQDVDTPEMKSHAEKLLMTS
jgi:choline kinase